MKNIEKPWKNLGFFSVFKDWQIHMKLEKSRRKNIVWRGFLEDLGMIFQVLGAILASWSPLGGCFGGFFET